MFSTLDYTLSQKQQDLLNTFRGLIEQHGIKIYLNEPLPASTEPLSVDVEHDEQGTFVCCGFFDSITNSYYGYTGTDTLCSVYSSSLRFVAHNWNGDFESLRYWGFPVEDSQLASDTMLFGHILDSSLKTYGLKDMAKRELGIEYPDYDKIVGKHKGKTTKIPKCPQNDPGCCGRVTLDKQPIELTILYNAMDCMTAAKLFEKQAKASPTGNQLTASTSRYFNEVEKPVSRVFEAMSVRGTRLDLDYLRSLKDILESQQKPLKETILNELGPILLSSPKQLLGALNAKGLYPENRKGPSVDKEALGKLPRVPLTENLASYNELDTLLTTFVYRYLERGVETVHPFFNQVGTRTGRLSCSNPNLLQIPTKTINGKLVRRMFIPRDGYVMGDADYGQIEPRIMAHLSQDPTLCEMFNSGQNFHEFTQQRMGFSSDDAGYARAKVLNLSVGYRATFKSVSAQLGCSDEEAQTQINKWWSLFPVLRRWQDKLIYDSKRSEFCTTLLGRCIRIDDLSHGNSWRREGAERQLINNMAQGSAREVMVMGMLKIAQDKRFSPTFGILIQVYDNLVWESEHPEIDEQLVVENMENAVKLRVPLKVSSKIGPNWADVIKV